MLVRKVPLTVGREELLVDESDDMFREMVHRGLAYSLRLQSVRDAYARYIGLTGIQYTILVSVAHMQNKSTVGVNAISKHLSLSATFITTEGGKLVEMGLMKKSADKNDGRRVVLSLTNKAWKLLEELSDIQKDINDVGFQPLSREDFLTLHRLFGELTRSSDRSLALINQKQVLKDTL